VELRSNVGHCWLLKVSSLTVASGGVHGGVGSLEGRGSGQRHSSSGGGGVGSGDSSGGVGVSSLQLIGDSVSVKIGESSRCVVSRLSLERIRDSVSISIHGRWLDNGDRSWWVQGS